MAMAVWSLIHRSRGKSVPSEYWEREISICSSKWFQNTVPYWVSRRDYGPGLYYIF